MISLFEEVKSSEELTDDRSRTSVILVSIGLICLLTAVSVLGSALGKLIFLEIEL